MNRAERDRARIAELRRQARLAQGRDPDAEDGGPAGVPARRWEPEAGAGPLWVKVGPGTPVLGLEEAARRLRWSTATLGAKVAAGELESVMVGGFTRMVPLSEVERIERSR